MSTNFAVTVTASGRAAVPGAPSGYVEDILALEHEMWQAVDPALCVSAILAGGIPGVAGSLLTERDRADTSRIWTADNALLSIESDPAVMRGQKRFVTSGQAQEGFRGAIPTDHAAYAGFSLFLPDVEVRSLAANNALFSLGTGTASSALLAYISTLGRINYHHGVGSGGTAVVTTEAVTVGQRNSILISAHKVGDLNWAGKVFLNSTTAAATATINKNLPTSTPASWFGLSDDSISSNLKSMGGYAFKAALGEDADTVAALMSIGQRMRALT